MEPDTFRVKNFLKNARGFNDKASRFFYTYRCAKRVTQRTAWSNKRTWVKFLERKEASGESAFSSFADLITGVPCGYTDVGANAMSMTATADWRLIADKPELVRQIERPTTAEPSKYRQYAALANSLAVAVDQDWAGLDERIRHALRIIASCTMEPHRVISQWEMFRSRVTLTVAFNKDREAVLEWSEALKRARSAVLSAIERENEDYTRSLTMAINEATSGATERPTMTAREASDFIRSL